jgi:hypothetical protein
MILSLFKKDGSSNDLSSFTNPFDKSGVDWVSFNYHKTRMFRKNKRGSATVYFKKGDTEGKQEFFSDDFQDLIKQVDTFINSLK